MFFESTSKGLHQSLGKEKESWRLFPSSTKHEIRQFYVVVVDGRTCTQRRDAREKNLWIFRRSRSRCRRRRRCVNSLIIT